MLWGHQRDVGSQTRSWGAASRTTGQHSRSELWIWEGDVDAFRVLTGGSFLGWQRSHQSLVGQSWLMSLWHEVHVGLADVWKVKLGWAWRPTQVFCEVKGMEEGEQPMCSGWMRFEYARVTWRMGFVPDQQRGCSTQGERWQGHGREVATKTHGLPKAVMHLLWSLHSHFVHSLWIKKKKKPLEILWFVLSASGSLRTSVCDSSVLALCPLKCRAAGDKVSAEFYCMSALLRCDDLLEFTLSG